MCVKCGINSCSSCNGKDLLSQVTGDITYDGLTIACTENFGGINSGDKLNPILDKIVNALCIAAEPPYVASIAPAITPLPAISLVNSIQWYTIPQGQGGDWYVRATLVCDITNDVDFDYWFIRDFPSPATEFTPKVRITTSSNTTTQTRTFVIEGTYTLAAGETITSYYERISGAGVVDANLSMFYAKRVS